MSHQTSEFQPTRAAFSSYTSSPHPHFFYVNCFLNHIYLHFLAPVETWASWGEQNRSLSQSAPTSKRSNLKRWKNLQCTTLIYRDYEIIDYAVLLWSFHFFYCLTLISLHINILVYVYFKLYLMKEIWPVQFLTLELKRSNIMQSNIILIYPCIDFVSDWKCPVCVSLMGICDRWAKEWEST